MKLLIATTNEGKKKELFEAFEQYGLTGIEFLSLRDVDVSGEPDESAATFEANALIKAEFFGTQTGLPTLGEDSGLILSEFPKKFGVRTRREITASSDQHWLAQFLTMLDGASDRGATFYSATAFFDPSTKDVATFLGSTSGKILDAPKADLEPGIPVSSVFLANGQEKVYSALDKNQKNEISHRGKSVKQLVEYLQSRV